MKGLSHLELKSPGKSKANAPTMASSLMRKRELLEGLLSIPGAAKDIGADFGPVTAEGVGEDQALAVAEYISSAVEIERERVLLCRDRVDLVFAVARVGASHLHGGRREEQLAPDRRAGAPFLGRTVQARRGCGARCHAGPACLGAGFEPAGIIRLGRQRAAGISPRCRRSGSGRHAGIRLPPPPPSKARHQQRHHGGIEQCPHRLFFRRLLFCGALRPEKRLTLRAGLDLDRLGGLCSRWPDSACSRGRWQASVDRGLM